MACAQTGSGKTAAFLFPLLAMILKDDVPSPNMQSSNFSSRAKPYSLILAPTRELATQIHTQACKFTYRTGLKPVVVYGGVDIRQQIRDLSRGCDILVATPGRLVDLLERGKVSLSLVSYLVFDEADRMLDMGFEPQIRQIVEHNDLPADKRQTLMFSATFPKEIQKLAQDFLTGYIFLAVGRVGSTTDFITQKLEFCPDQDKREHLMSILPKCEGLTLIFVETKRGADTLEDYLSREGIPAASIHGDRTQPERESALQMFKCGRCPVLVATDVAARGLDIPNVLHVINYDLPNNIDDYVHRIGRTGRMGNKGTAIAFVNEKNKPILRDLRDLLEESKQDIPRWFDNLTREASWTGGGGGNRSRGRGRGRGNFGGRDYRKFDNFDSYDRFAPPGGAPGSPRNIGSERGGSRGRGGGAFGPRTGERNGGGRSNSYYGRRSGGGDRGGDDGADAWF